MLQPFTRKVEKQSYEHTCLEQINNPEIVVLSEIYAWPASGPDDQRPARPDPRLSSDVHPLPLHAQGDHTSALFQISILSHRIKPSASTTAHPRKR